MGKIIALLPGVKSELQNFHAGIAAFPEHFPDSLRQISQILGDNIQFAQFFLHRLKKSDAGARLPVSFLRRLVSIGNGIIRFKSPEMVDADHIVQAEAGLDPADPPGIAGFLMLLPPVQGVAPQLSGGRESVRRTAGHRQGHAVFIELEQLRIGPGIRAVQGHIDGDVSYDTDPPVIGILFQFFPLDLKTVLLETVKTDLLRQFPPGPVQSFRIPGLQFLRPFLPGPLSLTALDRHIQTVILQPVRVFIFKFQEFLCLTEAGKGLPKNRKTCFVNSPVVHIAGFLPAVRLPALLLGEQSLLPEGIQIYIVRIPGEGGERLIGRISVAGGPQGQDLPVLLPCLLQPVHKFIRFL